MTLGQKLKQTRLARGMTQSQVVGDRITRNMLSLIENDLSAPSMIWLRRRSGRWNIWRRC